MPTVDIILRTTLERGGANEAVKMLRKVAQTAEAQSGHLAEALSTDALARAVPEGAIENIENYQLAIGEVAERYVRASQSAFAFGDAASGVQFLEKSKEVISYARQLERAKIDTDRLTMSTREYQKTKSQEVFQKLQGVLSGTGADYQTLSGEIQKYGVSLKAAVLQNLQFEGGLEGAAQKLREMAARARNAAAAVAEEGDAAEAAARNRLADNLDSIANELHRVDTAADNTGDRMGALTKIFGTALDGLNRLGFGLFLITQNLKTAQMIIGGAFNALLEGAERIDKEQAFGAAMQSMGASAEEFNKEVVAAAKNLIPLIAVQEAANKAVREGNSELAQAAPQIAQIAAGYALAIGEVSRTEEIFNALFEGIRKGQPDMLKNAGIFTSNEEAAAALNRALGTLNNEQLSVQERSEALLQVVLDQGDAYRELADDIQSAAAPLVQFRNRLGDVSGTIKQIIVAGFVQFLNDTESAIDDTSESVETFSDNLKDLATDFFVSFSAIKNAIVIARDEVNEFLGLTKGAGLPLFEEERRAAKEFSGQIKDLREQMASLGTPISFEEAAKIILEQEGLYRDLSDATRITGVFLEQFNSQVESGLAPVEASIQATEGLQESLQDSGVAAQEAGAFISAFQKELQKTGDIDAAMQAASSAVRELRNTIGGLPPEMMQVAAAGGAFIQAGEDLSFFQKVANESLKDVGEFRDLLFGVAEAGEQISSGGLAGAIQDIARSISDIVAEGRIDAALSALESIQDGELALQADLLDAWDDFNERYNDIAEEEGERLSDIWQDRLDKLADAEEDFQDKIDDINDDLGDKLSDIQEDATEDRIDAAEDRNDKLEKIERDHQRRLRDIERKFQQSRLRALIDRDAEALFEAEQNKKLELKKENERYRDKIKEAQEAYEEEIQQIREQEEEKRQEAIEAAEERRQDALEAYEERQQDIIEAYEEEREEILEQYAERRADAVEAYNDQATDLIGSYNERILLTRLKEAAVTLEQARELGLRGQDLENHLDFAMDAYQDYYNFLLGIQQDINDLDFSVDHIGGEVTDGPGGGGGGGGGTPPPNPSVIVPPSDCAGGEYGGLCASQDSGKIYHCPGGFHSYRCQKKNGSYGWYLVGGSNAPETFGATTTGGTATATGAPGSFGATTMGAGAPGMNGRVGNPTAQPKQRVRLILEGHMALQELIETVVADAFIEIVE